MLKTLLNSVPLPLLTTDVMWMNPIAETRSLLPVYSLSYLLNHFSYTSRDYQIIMYDKWQLKTN